MSSLEHKILANKCGSPQKVQYQKNAVCIHTTRKKHLAKQLLG